MAMDGDREAIRELILLSPSWLLTCRVLELRVRETQVLLSQKR